MSGFALNLDLTLYFEDLRKFCSIFVDSSKCKEVGDVETHIKSVFKLEDSICLTNKKFLIPRCEDIQILQQYETLKVQKCDFFDHQIHKNKRTNPACDQTALNLIQSERTIDLSCRPKQRLKINICQNNCISGAPLTPFVESSKNQNIAQTSTAFVLDEVCHIQSTEKQKNKKKKHEELNSCVENGVDILDMSVKKSKRRKYENCFSRDRGHDLDIEMSAKCSEKNIMPFEMDQENSIYESQGKSKKRKKHSPLLYKDLDLANSCWNRLVSDNDNTINDYVKKRNKKSKLKRCNKEDDDEITDLSVQASESRDKEKEDVMLSSTIYEEYNSLRKKQKKEKRSTELRESCDTYQYGQDYLSSFDCSIITNVEESDCNDKSDRQNVYFVKKTLEENKRNVEVKGNKCLEELNLMTSCKPGSNNGDNENSNHILNSAEIKQQNFESIGDPCRKWRNNEEKSNNKEESMRPCVGFLEGNVKRKRTRKHNKKKKKENLKYVSAVGSMLKALAVQPQEHLSPVSSDSGRHIFFDDKDVAEEINIPSSPSTSLNADLPDCCGARSDGSTLILTNQITSDQSVTWQHKLLKLASCSKPVVFHRNNPTPSVKTGLPSQKFPDPSMKDIAKDLSAGAYNDGNRSFEGANSISGDFQKCNGEIKAVNGVEENMPTPELSRRVPDTVLPHPTDIQNIILTNYPVIDKVVAEDFILFKVLKLNENNQPDVSKTILAKVNCSTSFPEKISLQVMEGCEECDPWQKTVESSEGFIIELRWSDILEPRLFYP